ncbi:branched-chain amino acid transport system substrate-binding protein [Amycolatopsis bartoniae]|nr:ABC transporter substrate-binding protein [Amycolatopsis bartoniae]MBB2938385.1 branched-chain amino acid transport system substrate-binding protein [Amycolatopsis bartoniae]TVT10212.1 ABC transporter substrate-binding protein [Amycolatopsis bartoniae]
MNSSSRKTRLACLMAAVLTLAGCSETATTGGSPDNAATTTTIDDSIGASFSGGSAGAATGGKTIKVGLINQEGGTVSDPEVSAAIQAAFSYVNEKQSGIKGATLQLEVCKIGSSEEEAQQCAQRFLNDPSISVVMQGGLNVGTQAVHQTINGKKPTLVTLANPGTDTTAAGTYTLNPNVLASIPGMLTYVKSKGYKNLVVVSSDDPGDLQIAQYAKQTYEAAGLHVTNLTFPQSSTDLTSTFTSAVNQKADAIMPLVATTSGCTAAALALQQLGASTPIIGTSLCATDDLHKTLGDFPKWSFEANTLLQYADDPTGQMSFYKAVMAKYAPGSQIGIGAPAAFGAAFALAKVLNTIGPDAVTPDSVAKGLAGYTDGVLLGTPKVKFGSVEGSPALSGIADRFYTYEGNDHWTATDWANLPR